MWHSIKLQTSVKPSVTLLIAFISSKTSFRGSALLPTLPSGSADLSCLPRPCHLWRILLGAQALCRIPHTPDLPDISLWLGWCYSFLGRGHRCGKVLVSISYQTNTGTLCLITSDAKAGYWGHKQGERSSAWDLVEVLPASQSFFMAFWEATWEPLKWYEWLILG